MVPVTCGHGPVQRVKTKEATQTLPRRSSSLTALPLRSVSEKVPTGPRSSIVSWRQESPPSNAAVTNSNNNLRARGQHIKVVACGETRLSTPGEYEVRQQDDHHHGPEDERRDRS